MSKMAVIYWTGGGNTKAMADGIVQGAKEAGADVSLFEVTEITPQQAAEYEKLALGCPAMGAEVLEESDFEPFYTALEGSLSGKKVALFGSYGWGDGEWMRSWQERLKNAGGILFQDEGLIINEASDDAGLETCKKFGAGFASA